MRRIKHGQWSIAGLCVGMAVVLSLLFGAANDSVHTASNQMPLSTSTATPYAQDTQIVTAPALQTPQTGGQKTAAILTPTPTAQSTPVTHAQGEQPPMLTKMFQTYGLSLPSCAATQLLLLAYDPGHTKLYLYDKDDAGLWRLTRSFDASVGKNGVSEDKVEGDKTTPIGFYPIGFAFGNADKPDTRWSYRNVTKESYWVDDAHSAYYNTWVEGTEDKDWDSAEHLCDAKNAYAYALVIEYNMHPIIPGKGSAIFLHCGTSSTAGCIALAQSDVLQILKWIDPDAAPYILIGVVP